MPALEAVLADLANDRIDVWLCPGDLVGYGPMPDACVAAVAALNPVAAVGNHDLIAVGRLTTERCSPLARATLEWTQAAISDRTRTWLGALPPTARTTEIVVAHGSLDDPRQYVRTPAEAATQLAQLAELHPDARVLVLGHTHVQQAVGERRGELLRAATGTVAVGRGERILLNAGSVGQSRDRWPRARFLVLDTDRGTAEFRSVRYDAAAVRRALRAAGLPEGACHEPPYASSRLGMAAARRTPRPVRRQIRRVRRWAAR
jgi:diadenosine tetraphosphatase ApaH/serine/threonine PP2A family protein phosphatase